MSTRALFTYTSVSQPRRVERDERTDATCERIPPPTQIVRVADDEARLLVERSQPEFVLVEFRTPEPRSEPLADLSTLF